jgi:hypothetical protein
MTTTRRIAFARAGAAMAATILAVTGTLASAATAFAQAPAPAPLPSYARPTAQSDEETITGRIAAISGTYDLQVRDDRGFIDRVRLHPGTIIHPTGLQLAPGMSVTIAGRNDGNVLTANEIDAPYSETAPYIGYWPYAVYPYPVYVTRPFVSFGFRFGGEFHRGFHRGFHRWR